MILLENGAVPINDDLLTMVIEAGFFDIAVELLENFKVRSSIIDTKFHRLAIVNERPFILEELWSIYPILDDNLRELFHDVLIMNSYELLDVFIVSLVIDDIIDLVLRVKMINLSLGVRRPNFRLSVPTKS